MAHCPYEKLADLEPVLDVVRQWVAIKEKKPGIFYFKALPFLHFHEKDGERWADVRDGKTWGEPVAIPFESTKTARGTFQREVRRRYESLAKPK